MAVREFIVELVVAARDLQPQIAPAHGSSTAARRDCVCRRVHTPATDEYYKVGLHLDVDVELNKRRHQILP